MNPQCGKLSPARGELPIGLQQTQGLEVRKSFLHRCLWRGIEPGQILAQTRSPLGELHQNGLGICQKELRWAEIRPALLLGERPQTDALPGTLPASSASTLFGACQAAGNSF